MNYVTKQSRFNMKLNILLLVTLVVISNCDGDQSDSEAYLSRFLADLWLEGSDIIKIIWRDCSKKLVDVKVIKDQKENFPKFIRCMKRKTLRALDRSLSSDVVPVVDGVNLVRFELVDVSGNTLPINSSSGIPWEEAPPYDDNDDVWNSIYRYGTNSNGISILAVLGGKALLLAKMALILASIQGLKKVDTIYDGFHDKGKIASSPVNYGFYHSYPYEHLEKRSIDNWQQTIITSPTPTPKINNRRPCSNADITYSKIDKMDLNKNKEYLKEMKSTSDETTQYEDTGTQSQKIKSRYYPAYTIPSSSVDIRDAPTSDVDLTTLPGEVQADYTLDLPYHRFRFQSPVTVVPT